MRKCSQPVWGVALVAMLGAGTAGCEQIGMLKGKLAYKEANNLYAAGNYEAASQRYRDALAAGCSTGECQPEELNYAYFFLANSYDNMYRPARKGQAENDGYLQQALEYYGEAVEKSPDPKYQTLALQFMAAVYGADKLNDPARAEPIVQRLIELNPDDTNNYFQMSKLFEDSGDFERAEAHLLMARDVRPDDPEVYAQMARFYNGRFEFDKEIEALKIRAEKDPASPEAQYTIAVKYWLRACLPEKDLKDICGPIQGPAREKPGYITAGLEAAERALAIREDYIDALVYKGLLLRSQAYVEPRRADALNKEAEALLEQVQEIQKRQKGEDQAEAAAQVEAAASSGD